MPRLQNGAADMLSKLGSSRDAIPPEVALEHLRKPSIRPSMQSESIPMAPEPGSEAIPMDVDKGKSIAVSADSGTVQSDPGTSQPMEGVVVSANPAVVPILETLSSDVIMAISHFVDAISANPGTAESDPGTSQLLLAETHEKIFIIREVPTWVQPIMAYLTEGILPEDETMARKI